MGGAVQLDMSEVTSFLRVAATVPEDSHNDAVVAVGLAMAEWKRQTEGVPPPTDSGALAGAFSYNVTRGQQVIKGELVNPLKYALAIEKGRKPGKRPPVAPIALWVTRVLGISDPKKARSVAYVIARAIGKRGFSPNHAVGPKGARMVQKGLDAAEKEIMRLFAGVAESTIKRLEKS